MSERADGGTVIDAARLLKMVSKKHYHEIEAVWPEAVDNDSVASEDLLLVLEHAARDIEAATLESLLWYLLSSRSERKGPGHVLGIAVRSAGLFPESKTLRDEIAAAYRAAHSTRPDIAALVDATISRRTTPLLDAVRQIEKLLALSAGAFVLDPAGGEVGRVTGFDTERKSLAVEFKSGTRHYEPAAVMALESLRPDDFRALLVFEPESLAALAEEDPGELVTRVMRAFGQRMTFKTLRSRLAGVVPEGAWSKWWSMARPRLRRAPWIEMNDAAQPTFVLRQRAIAFEDILRAQFNGAASAEDKLLVVLNYLNETAARGGASPALLGFFAAQLNGLAVEWSERSPGEAIGALALSHEIRARQPDIPAATTDIEAILARQADPSCLLRPIQSDQLARLILMRIREAAPARWREVFASLMPGCTEGICGWVSDELLREGYAQGVRAAAAEILARPDRDVGALVWLWKTVSAADRPDALADLDPITITAALLSAADGLGRAITRGKAELHSQLVILRSALSARDFALVREVLRQADAARARMLRSQIERNTGLSEQARRRMLDCIRHAQPSLFVEHVPPWQEDAIYTTAEGLKRQQAAVSHLATTKLSEITKAVAEAGQRGDLSENAEYHAACEERGRIAARIALMNEELKKAKIITPKMAESDTVTIGSAVEARDLATGRTDTFVFLGPWDADPDRHIYSYRALIGLAFMGKRVGEHITLSTDTEERTWEIVSVRPAQV